MIKLSPAAQAVLAAPTRAAALRALVDQAVPVDRRSRRQMNIRAEILAIAAELAGPPNPLITSP